MTPSDTKEREQKEMDEGSAKFELDKKELRVNRFQRMPQISKSHYGVIRDDKEQISELNDVDYRFSFF